MNNIIAVVTAAKPPVSVAGCYTPGERAVGGADRGGLVGPAIGGAATGRASGALAGAAVGAAGGAVVGAATAPVQRRCPPGGYLAADGYCYPY